MAAFALFFSNRRHRCRRRTAGTSPRRFFSTPFLLHAVSLPSFFCRAHRNCPAERRNCFFLPVRHFLTSVNICSLSIFPFFSPDPAFDSLRLG